MTESQLICVTLSVAIVTAFLIWKFWPKEKPPDPLDETGEFPIVKRQGSK